jgi:iron(III) transport system ATP-binding protein
MNLSIKNLVKRFGAITALDNISLEIPHGALVCFLGPSGCGKTTLLRVIAGLEDTDSGELRLGEADLRRMPTRSRNFGVVFQSYSLFPNMSAARNIAYGLECRRWSKADMQARIREMLELVHLTDQADKLPAQMSGGQQQRVALARALAPNPSLLLLDEPLSALDAKVREDLRAEIRGVQQRLGITTIMVTHDQEEALAMADLIVVINQGHIEQIGPPRDLYEKPATRFVADFIGRMNVLPLDENASDRAVVFGGVALQVADAPGASRPRMLGVRPEMIALSGGHSSGVNVIPGTVRTVSYLGNLARVEVVPCARPDLCLIVELHGAMPVPTPHSEVAMTIQPHAFRVLQ